MVGDIQRMKAYSALGFSNTAGDTDWQQAAFKTCAAWKCLEQSGHCVPPPAACPRFR